MVVAVCSTDKITPEATSDRRQNTTFVYVNGY